MIAMSAILPNFVVFEGCDGSGTSTQLALLKTRLSANGDLPNGQHFFSTFEPTDGAIGRFIRTVLAGNVPLHAGTLARLFAADRNEHLYGKNGIVERTRAGELVVCDRYILSSLAYQGLECGEELPRRLNEDFPVPQTLIFFDIDSEVAQKRMDERPAKDIFEQLDFQIKVRSRYKAILDACKAQGTAVFTIDASKTIETIAQEVWEILFRHEKCVKNS